MTASKTLCSLGMKCLLIAFAVALGWSGCSGDEPTPCDECGPGTVCVQLLGGACGSTISCVPAVPGCEDPECSPECDEAYCDPGGRSTCSGPPCPEDIPGAFQCYGV